jgi:hypothetical protein
MHICTYFKVITRAHMLHVRKHYTHTFHELIYPAHAHIHIHAYMYTCIHAHIHTYTRTCRATAKPTTAYWGCFDLKDIHTYTHIYTHINTYTHTHICTFAHIHIHTYTYFTGPFKSWLPCMVGMCRACWIFAGDIHTYVCTHTHTHTHTRLLDLCRLSQTHIHIRTYTHTHVWIFAGYLCVTHTLWFTRSVLCMYLCLICMYLEQNLSCFRSSCVSVPVYYSVRVHMHLYIYIYIYTYIYNSVCVYMYMCVCIPAYYSKGFVTPKLNTYTHTCALHYLLFVCQNICNWVYLHTELFWVHLHTELFHLWRLNYTYTFALIAHTRILRWLSYLSRGTYTGTG